MLVQMILEGASLSWAADNQIKNIALQLSQLIKFNALKRQGDQMIANVRHRSFQIAVLFHLHWFSVAITDTEKKYYR